MGVDPSDMSVGVAKLQVIGRGIHQEREREWEGEGARDGMRLAANHHCTTVFNTLAGAVPFERTARGVVVHLAIGTFFVHDINFPALTSNNGTADVIGTVEATGPVPIAGRTFPDASTCCFGAGGGCLASGSWPPRHSANTLRTAWDRWPGKLNP